MQFYNHERLILLWLVPAALLWLLFACRRRLRLALAFAEAPVLGRLDAESSFVKRRIRQGCLMLAILFLALALARPQWGHEVKVVKRHGVDIIFMVDTSLSMLAEDVRPNRITVAKRELQQFLKQMKGDRIGMVAFAGSGFLQVPLTLDQNAFQLFSDALEVGLVPEPGTSFPEALGMAVQGFRDTGKDYRVVVVLSDGESHDGDLDTLVQGLREAQVKVYAIGIGTEKGAPIPLRSETGELVGQKKDVQGATVLTRLNGAGLQALAAGTGGLYYAATASFKESGLIYEHIQTLEKKELHEQQVVQREDHFQAFLMAAFFVLLLEVLTNERKGTWR